MKAKGARAEEALLSRDTEAMQRLRPLFSPLRVALPKRALLFAFSYALRAREQPSGVSPRPHLLLGVTHFLCSASFLLLDGPLRSRRIKRRRKEPVVYVHFISPPQPSEEVLDGSPTRGLLVISSRQGFR